MAKKILVLPEVFDEVHTGGPFAVVRKMFELDKVTFNYIRINGVLKREKEESNGKEMIGNVLRIGWIKFIHIFYKLIKQYFKLRKLNLYQFDTVISHDPIISYCLLKFYKNINTIAIYHGQGSLYNELVDLLGVSPSKMLSKLLNGIELYIINNAFKIGFPSIGAFEALITTNPFLKDILIKRMKDRVILYNGVNLYGIQLSHNPEIENCLINEGYNLVTISSLNEAKGVDRIPKFLGGLKKSGINFSWIVIGKGKLSEKLKVQIQLNNIEGSTYVFEKGYPKSEILGLLSKSDFYILFHRYSIFDLATLEAMYLGNIPILSNLGGNKEVIIEQNGLLLDEPFDDYDGFLKLTRQNILDLKLKNKKIILDKFSEANFIEAYRNLVQE